ncbi:MAG: hypothetical protein V4603_03040 [Pseudomonadota bacterium]
MSLRFRNLLPVLLSALPLAPLYADGLKPFTSDGCSIFPDGTPFQQNLWLECCRDHDYAYWKGGTYDERLQADNALRNCVSRVGEPEIAAMMLNGVRIGGGPNLPTPFRWGYGWPWPRSYQALTAEELKEVEDSMTREESLQNNGNAQ